MPNKINIPLTYKGIAGKLISLTILFSSIITLVITAFNLYERYSYDVNLIDLKFKQINDVHLSSIINNLWLVDKHELQVHLEGILKIKDIQYIEVYDNKKLWASAGVKKYRNIIVRSYPLKYTYKEKVVDIGELKVSATLDNVFHNMYQELWVTLATNGTKTFLVAFFMLFLFHNLVIRHLLKIAKDVTQFNIKEANNKIQLKRKDNLTRNEDELDLVVNAFNKLQKELKLSFSSIEKQVEHRTKELLEAKEEAIAASSAKTEFLARMSHELLTPMNAVLGFAQLLDADDFINQEQKENINEILTAGRHLLELINKVLDLSRIESGVLDLELNPVEVCNVINDSVSLIQPLLEKKNIKLTWDSKKQNKWVVLAEKSRLKEIIINLLSNAIKYNVDNGTIIIDCATHNNNLRVNVIDSGRGLSPEQQQQIFEPFNRAGAEITYFEGTGIGLTISKRLIELMDGEIGVESSIGKGCCFYIELKLAENNLEIK